MTFVLINQQNPHQTKVVNRIIYLLLVSTFKVTSSNNVWKEVSRQTYNLIFLRNAVNWGQAKSYCEQRQSRLVQLDETNVRNDVYNTVSSASGLSINYFWIGATDEASEGIWRWLDGSLASIPWKQYTEGSYEPNGNSRENYLVMSLNLEFFDTSSSFSNAGTICLQEHVATHNLQLSSTTTTITSTSGRSQFACWASGIPTPNVYWFKGSSKITFSTSQRIYQTTTSGRSNLNLRNDKITLEDEGQYKCQATNVIGGQSRSITIRVPSKPSIINIISSPCNSSLLLEWKPHVRAIGLEHRIIVVEQRNIANSKSQQISETKVFMRTIVTDLKSSTLYAIKIIPCRTVRCLTNYQSTELATTGGLPEPVTKPILQMNDKGACNVSWSWPMKTNKKYISSYKVTINSTSGHTSSHYALYFTMHMTEIKLPSSMMNLTIPKISNRKYNVSIQAQTCAGFGNAKVAVGECVTDTDVPSILQPVDIKHKVDYMGKSEIEVNTPDETNGSVSCFLIVVQTIDKHSNNSSIDNKRMIALKESQSDDEYIALAMNRNRFDGGISSRTFILGDGTYTSCDISGQSSNKSNYTYNGTNNRLDSNRNYRIFMVVSVPRKNDVLFKISKGQLLIEEAERSASESEVSITAISGISIGSVFGFAIICGLVFVTTKKLQNSGINMKKESENGNTVKHTEAPHTNSAYEDIPDISNHYEEIVHASETNPYENTVAMFYEDIH